MNYQLRQNIERFLVENAREEPYYVRAQQIYHIFGYNREVNHTLQVLDGHQYILLHLSDDGILGVNVLEKLRARYQSQG